MLNILEYCDIYRESIASLSQCPSVHHILLPLLSVYLFVLSGFFKKCFIFVFLKKHIYHSGFHFKYKICECKE